MSDIKTEESTNATVVSTEASTGEAPTKTTEHDVQYQDEETKAQVRFLKLKLKSALSLNSVTNQQLQVDLPKVVVKSGTEALECIFKMRIKLYRFRDDQWKERGVGNCKLMRDRANKRIRFVMRQEKTLKPVANFIGKTENLLNLSLVSDICDLTPMANNEKSFCWSAQDFSEGSMDVSKLAARFQSVEATQQFKAAFNAAREFNATAKKEDSKPEDLIWADTVEDLDEPIVDDIEINQTADADGGEED